MVALSLLGLLPGRGSQAQGLVIPLEPDAIIDGEGTDTYLTMRGVADLNADGASDALVDYSVRARGIRQDQQDIMLGRGTWPARVDRDDLEDLDSLGLPFVGNDMSSRDNDPFYGFRDFLDANGDGHADLAVFEQQRRMSEVIREEVKIYYGGEGWRTPDITRAAPDLTIVQDQVPQEPWQAETRPMPEQLLAGDFDGDGDQDLAVGSCHVPRGMEFDEGQTGTLRIFLSDEGGPARNISLRGGRADVRLHGETGPKMGCFGSFVGDFDGDGRDDILLSGSDLTNFEGSYAALLLGRETWPGEADVASLADVRFTHDVAQGGLRAIDARDLNGDGLAEVVFEYGARHVVQAYCAWLGGSDLPAEAKAADCPLVFDDLIYHAAGDLDADGRLDLIFELPYLAGDTGPYRYALLRGPIRGERIAIGEKAGSSLGDALLETASDQGQPEWFVADFSGDGADDLILARESATHPSGDEFAGRLEIVLGPLLEPRPEPSATPSPTLAPPTPSASPEPPPDTPTPTEPSASGPAAIYLPLGLRGAELGADALGQSGARTAAIRERRVLTD